MNEIDYNMMDKFVEEKNHLIINALSKDDFEKCHISMKPRKKIRKFRKILLPIRDNSMKYAPPLFPHVEKQGGHIS